MIFSMVRLFGIQDCASTAHLLPCYPIFPSLLSLLVAGNAANKQHTQLDLKLGIHSMACCLYAKCQVHEIEQKMEFVKYTVVTNKTQPQNL